MKRSLRKLVSYLVMVLMGTVLLHGETITANSVSQTDVQAAINAAQDGDTVMVPAGTATWTSNVAIPADRNITVRGAGMDSTVISGTGAFNISGPCRVSAFGFVHDTDFISASGRGWRIDHCRFTNTGSHCERGVGCFGQYGENYPRGVIDHCEFINSRVLVIGAQDLVGAPIWAEPLGLGTDNAVFVEDCIFVSTDVFCNAVDANYGGRYVFRYNTVTDTYIEAHSCNSDGNNRATRSWEIYENIIQAMNRNVWTPFLMRGGTGVIFNNTVTGSRWSNQTIAMDNDRSCFDSGGCNGSHPKDGNEEPNGYPCRDQIGRSTDAFEYQKDGNWPSQALDPAYIWNNVSDSGPLTVTETNCTDSRVHLQEGRDYYVGVERPGYRPFTYPHPLVSGSAGEDDEISPPSRLRLGD